MRMVGKQNTVPLKAVGGGIQAIFSKFDKCPLEVADTAVD